MLLAVSIKSTLHREALENYPANREDDQDPCGNICKNDPVPRAPRSIHSRQAMEAESA
jgi:hypothetical protein